MNTEEQYSPYADLRAPKYTFRFADGTLPASPNHKTEWASDKDQVYRAGKTWGACEIIGLSSTGKIVGVSVVRHF